MIKNIDNLIFILENRTVFFVFLLKRPIFEKTESKWARESISDKSNEKAVREKTYLLKLEFYNTDRKMQNTIRRIFISIIMHPNFMLYRRKISFQKCIRKFYFSQWAFENSLNINFYYTDKLRSHTVSPLFSCFFKP